MIYKSHNSWMKQIRFRYLQFGCFLYLGKPCRYPYSTVNSTILNNLVNESRFGIKNAGQILKFSFFSAFSLTFIFFSPVLEITPTPGVVSQARVLSLQTIFIVKIIQTSQWVPIIKGKSKPYCHGRSGFAFHEYFPCDKSRKIHMETNARTMVLISGKIIGTHCDRRDA